LFTLDLCRFWFSRLLIEWYLAHWLFLEQGGTWRQYGTRKWYAIRKSLRTTALDRRNTYIWKMQRGFTYICTSRCCEVHDFLHCKVLFQCFRAFVVEMWRFASFSFYHEICWNVAHMQSLFWPQRFLSLFPGRSAEKSFVLSKMKTNNDANW